MEQRPEKKAGLWGAGAFNEQTEAKVGTVVVLRQKGTTIDNIAKELHMNTGTVRKILRREADGQA
jgi:orotate phosphoribosyltransferase-like protein